MDKKILLAGVSTFALLMSVSASALANGANADASATVSDNTAVDDGSLRENLIEDSYNGGAAGVAHVQQNEGNNNAINAATSVHADVTGGTPIISAATADSISRDNETSHTGEHEVDRANEILDTMVGFEGTATLQQNNGDNNAINSATALDGIDGGVLELEQSATAVGESSGQLSKKPSTTGKKTQGIPLLDDGSVRENLIDPSFNDARGVITVQQNNGSANAMSAATAVAGVAGNSGSLTQTVTAHGIVDGNWTEGNGTERDNRIQNSFERFEGVLTVQQNNGDANSMNAATGLIFSTGKADGDMAQSVELNENTITDSESATYSKKIAKKKTKEVGGGSATRGNLIDPSFTDATGVITVQQNNGDASSINAGTGVTGVLGDLTGEIESSVEIEENDIELGSFGKFVIVKTPTVPRADNEILNSFNGAAGTITVQQNNGDTNSINVGSAVAFVGGTVGGNATQDVSIKDNDVFTAGTLQRAAASESKNLIDPSFTGAVGVLTVQQNNGDANSMNVGNAVLAVAGDLVGHFEQSVDVMDNDINLTGKAAKLKYQGVSRANEILDSFETAAGVITVQQNNGEGNTINAGTGLAALIGDATTINQTADATGHKVDGEFQLPSYPYISSNLIDRSFSSVTGVITVQQNNGTSNSMNVANAAAYTIGSSDALEQTALTGGEVINNVGGSGQVTRTNTVTSSSFSGAKGVVTVQQNNGDSNVISAANAIMANLGDGQLGDVTQTASATGTVDDAKSYAYDQNGTRLNTLNDGIFQGAQGVVTVQQNNGSNNVMGATNAVRIQIGSDASDGALEDVTSQAISATGTVNSSRAMEFGDFAAADADRHNLLTNSFKSVNGVVTIQQNNGDNNSIGASTGIAADISGVEDIDDVSASTASTTGTVDDNRADDEVANRLNTIDGDEANSLAGVATVQQNNGNNNAMNAATGVSANIGTSNSVHGSVSADSSGSATVTNNTAIVTRDTERMNTLDGSFDSVQGVFTVQQNNGDNNSIGAATSVAASTGTPGFGPAASTASLGATVSGNSNFLVEISGGPTLTNTQAGAFASASGIMTVQQNNGNNNGMGSAITAVANNVSFGFNN